MKGKSPKTFVDGDLVFAKVRGYPAWPARVTSAADTKGTKYNVFFYGTHETGVCKKEEMWLFNDDTKAKFGKQKRKFFVEAVLEIENNPEIALEDMALSAQKTDEETGDDNSALEQSSADEDFSELPFPVTPATTPKKRPNKRKAEDSASKPPPAKQAKRNSGQTSRSGRVIKEKKSFVDESPTLDTSPRAGQRKMWVRVLSSGDIVEINLDRDRPITFDSKDSEIQWERASAINALKFKSKAEGGSTLPEELRRKLESKVSMTPEEEELLAKEKKEAIKQEKLTWLKIEQRLVDLDIELKKCLSVENPDIGMALDFLEELASTSVSQLMFKKQPQVVETIRKLRKYVGPATPSPDPKEEKEVPYLAEKIRLLADTVFTKIQAAFGLSGGTEFASFFSNAVAEFKMATKNLDKKRLTVLVSDPTLKKVSSVE